MSRRWMVVCGYNAADTELIYVLIGGQAARLLHSLILAGSRGVTRSDLARRAKRLPNLLRAFRRIGIAIEASQEGKERRYRVDPELYIVCHSAGWW